MADAKTFFVVGTSGPLTGGAAGMSISFVDKTGAARTAPVITELFPGQYEIQPTDNDEAVGSIALIDTGAGNEPRRVCIACFKGDNSNQFWALHLEDTAGALWAGAAPTWASYRDKTGASRTPPTLGVVLGAYLWSATPTSADVTADVSGRIDAPAGAAQSYFSVASDTANPWAAASSGPLLNPAADMVAFLNGKTAGGITLVTATNLFVGPMRNQLSVASMTVALLNTSGGQPAPYLHSTRKSLYSPSVQCVVRSPVADFAAGETCAREVMAWLHQRVVAPYIGWLARESAPVYLGEDSDNRSMFSVNFDAEFDAALS